jgi:cytidine deaminase
MDAKTLIAIAEKAKENAHAPYSGFHVGAAILAGSGKAYAGCNVESVSFGATICAERTALVSAVAAGETSFEALAVTADKRPVFPCGICRQLISEWRIPRIYIAYDGGKYETYSAEELLPHAFTLGITDSV